MSIFKRAKRIAKTAMSGTSAVLDIAYELSGRKVEVLHQGAAFLYDISRTSQPEPFRPATSAPVEVITPTPAPEPEAPAAAEEAANAEPEAAPEAAEPEAVAEEPAPAPEPEAVAEEPEPEAVAEEPEPATEPEPAPVEAEEVPEEPEEVVFPIENYDKLNVRQVQAALEGLSEAQLTVVRDYERKKKKRKTILRAINKAIS